MDQAMPLVNCKLHDQLGRTEFCVAVSISRCRESSLHSFASVISGCHSNYLPSAAAAAAAAAVAVAWDCQE